MDSIQLPGHFIRTLLDLVFLLTTITTVVSN